MTQTHNLLFHGTSSARLNSIIAAGQIDPAPSGDRHVSMSECPEVAAYFANIAALEDEDSMPVILVINADKVDAHPFSSNVWGEGECDWEREMASQKPVLLKSIEKIELQARRNINSFDHLR